MLLHGLIRKNPAAFERLPLASVDIGLCLVKDRESSGQSQECHLGMQYQVSRHIAPQQPCLTCNQDQQAATAPLQMLEAGCMAGKGLNTRQIVQLCLGGKPRGAPKAVGPAEGGEALQTAQKGPVVHVAWLQALTVVKV